MVKQALRMGTTIIVLSAALVCSAFEEKELATKKEAPMEKVQAETISDEECPEVCYKPYLKADDYYIGKVNPNKYEEWAEKHDPGSIYNNKFRMESEDKNSDKK